MQVTVLLGTDPFEVAGLNVQLAVSTVLPGGCWTVTVALVKDTSVIVSVHMELGQPGAPEMGDTGGSVVTENDTLPFLISLAGMASLPVSVTCAGVLPGRSIGASGIRAGRGGVTGGRQGHQDVLVPEAGKDARSVQREPVVGE